MRVIVDHIDHTARNIRTYWFKPPRKPEHIAGQFIELFLPHTPKDKRGNKRWFSLSSSPSEELLSITTKFAAENGSSFKAALAELKPGDELSLSRPMGDFVLPKDASVPLVFIAGGIGVTPMRSMIKWLHDTKQQRDITLIYGVTSNLELAFTDLFSKAAITFIPVVKDPTKGYKGQTGTLDAERILNLIKLTDQTKIYLSGPEPMVENIVKDLKLKGVNKRQLVTDYFPGYTSF